MYCRNRGSWSLLNPSQSFGGPLYASKFVYEKLRTWTSELVYSWTWAEACFSHLLLVTSNWPRTLAAKILYIETCRDLLNFATTLL